MYKVTFRKTCTNPNISFSPLFIFTTHDYVSIIKVSSSSDQSVAITYDVNIFSSSFICWGTESQRFCDYGPLLVWSGKQIKMFISWPGKDLTDGALHLAFIYLFVCLLWYSGFLCLLYHFHHPKGFWQARNMSSQKGEKDMCYYLPSLYIYVKEYTNYRSDNNQAMFQTAADNQSPAAIYCPIFVITGFSSSRHFK